jgi:uracil-DNA glycosylase family 4
MSKGGISSLDENTRRYYLDVMGIQCWQLLETEQRQNEVPLAEKNNNDVEPQQTNTTSWSSLAADIQQCDQCPLHASRKQAISGQGDQSAELMFVLLSPKPGDDASDILCGGEEHELLGKMLSAINVSIDDVYITSLLKCSVPANHTVSRKEIQLCNTYLKQQIQLIKPKLLVILGETAIRCLWQKNLSLDDYRAMNNEPAFLFESLPLFVTYSPRELIQQAENKRQAWTDLQRLQRLIESDH